MKYLLHLVSEFMTTKAFHLREEALELERLSRSLKAHIREVDAEEKDRRTQKQRAEIPITISKLPEHKDYLSIQEIMERVGIGRTKLYAEINAGRLKANKCGRQTRISLENFQKWINGFSEY